MDFDDSMKRFRLASRELFNQYFHVPDPWKKSDMAWGLEERFSEVESLLFQKLVMEPASLPYVAYKSAQFSVGVELAEKTNRAPLLLNREIKSGYWDHKINEVNREAVMVFIQFFDWDVLSYRDNRFVRVQIESWPSHQELVGKHALIDIRYVRFTKVKKQSEKLGPDIINPDK